MIPVLSWLARYWYSNSVCPSVRLSVCLSVCHVPVSYRNGLTCHHTFVSSPSRSSFPSTKVLCEIPTGFGALNIGGVYKFRIPYSAVTINDFDVIGNLISNLNLYVELAADAPSVSDVYVSCSFCSSASVLLKLLHVTLHRVRCERHRWPTARRHFRQSVRNCRLPVWERRGRRRSSDVILWRHQDVDVTSSRRGRRRRRRRPCCSGRARSARTLAADRDVARLGHVRVVAVLTSLGWSRDRKFHVVGWCDRWL